MLNERVLTDTVEDAPEKKRIGLTGSMKAPETREFWLEEFLHVSPLDFRLRATSSARHQRRSIELGLEETGAMRAWCQFVDCELPAFFMGLYAILLRRCADHSDDMVIRGAFEQTPGDFVQVVPYVFPAGLRDESDDIAGVLRHSQSLFRHLAGEQGLSLPLLDSLLPGESIKPYFQVRPCPGDTIPGTQQATGNRPEAPDEVRLLVADSMEGIRLELDYDESTFPDPRFLERLASLARQTVSGTEPLAGLDILLDDEHVVRNPDAVDAALPAAFVPVHAGFESWAERQPDAVAIRFGEEAISYAECNRRANRLARHLTASGVHPGDPVGICLEPSPGQVIAILAILKSGAWYVPMDPAYPASRKQFMARDAGVAVIVTSLRLAQTFEGDNLLLVCPERDADSIAAREAGDPKTVIRPEDTAYVIYTSGTTGQPKGVVVSHRNVQRLFEATRAAFRFTEHDVWTLCHSVAFDFSVWEIWGALWHGGCLVVVPDTARRDPRLLLELLNSTHVTVLNQTPVALYALIREIERDPLPVPSLRLIMFGGEALIPARLKAWFDRHGDRRPRLVNLYGITETTVLVTSRPLCSEDATQASGSMIGMPIPEWRLHILDRALRPMPPGWAGELCVGGAGVAKGYLNRPDLTETKFVADPFSALPGDRLYRSGDLARWTPGGQDVEYLGRLDLQVKIRGYRLELGEIETVLLRHPEIQDVAVIADEEPSEPGSKRLIAYVVFRNEPMTGSLLREFLLQGLPSYMVPAVFVTLNRLPLTPHGKLDRRTLPAPESLPQETSCTPMAPRDPVEQALARLWREVLSGGAMGVHDNFFECGGHSLAATQLVSRIRDTFGCELPLRAVFESPTISGLAARIAAGGETELPPLLPASRNQPLPLSFSQERVWFLQKLDPDNRAYDSHFTLHCTGTMNVGVLEQTLTEIVRRHEIYRTTFVDVEGCPRQVIHPPLPIRLPLRDMSEVPADVRNERIRAIIRDEVAVPFSLDRLPLVRWSLIRLGEQEHILLHVEHHMIHDGWSFVVFLRELVGLYKALLAGEPPPWPEPERQFVDFACWQRSWMDGPVGQKQLDYWKRQLAGSPVELQLPYDRPRPPRQTFKGRSLRMEMSRTEVSALEALAQTQGVTLYMLMLAAFQALLARYTGQDDIVVGAGIANRRVRETESLMGMLLNNVVLRTDLSGDPSFEALLKRVKPMMLGAYASQDVPFDRVVEAVNPPRRPDLPPLFQVLFSSYDGGFPALELPGVTLRLDEALGNGSAKFDLTVITIVRSRTMTSTPAGVERPATPTAQPGRSILLVWEYNSDLFDAATMERMIGHYQQVLSAVVDDPRRKLSELKLMTPIEESRLRATCCGKEVPYPRESCIHEVFSRQAELTPDAPAIRFQGQEVTYRELDERAKRLARYLRSRGVGPEVPVGLCLERSIDLLVGMLGILKAGGAYVPLDPDYPRERLDFMMRDTGAALVVTRSPLADRLAFPTGQTVCLDVTAAAIERESPAVFESGTGPDHLAYVIYTSGSTGLPKGVSVVHRGVVRLVKGTDYVEFGPDQVFLQYAPVSFDAATFEMFGALLNGATLVIAPPGLLALDELGKLIRQEGVTTLWLTAALFHQMVDHALPYLAGVRQLLAGGDVLSPDHVARFLREYPDHWLINGYGPTEATTFTCCHRMKGACPTGASVPIGRPIANTQVYILDSRHHPVPMGLRGELFIGGDGLARGYFNRPELTAERFVPDPVSGDPAKRLYRTGDWARWRGDGALEFLGRVDHQVKIRGFRVELGEIEAALRRHPGVGDAVVTVQNMSPVDRRLIAYVIPSGGEAPTERALQDSLRSRCPAYMVPSRCLVLPTFPLTTGGKVDRAALPLPTPDPTTRENRLRTLDEWRMSEIWCNVLGVEDVDAQDNFFDRGGHSLLGLRLVACIGDTFGVECPLRILFEAPTIRDLVQWVHMQGNKTHAGAAGYTSYASQVLAIQRGTTRPPLFLVPGGAGREQELMVYARMFRHMGKDLPIHGFLAHGGDGVTPPITRVKAMAAAYIREMKTIQSSGPYYLAGECRGGAVAYEMARQLRIGGDGVAFLGLLDTAFPGWTTFVKFLVTRRLRRLMDEALHRVIHFSEGHPFRCALAELAGIPRTLGDEFGVVRVNRHPGDERARREFSGRVEAIYPQTLLRYQPKPYSGDVTLILSSGFHQTEHLWKAWLGYVRGSVDINIVPGNHSSYIRDHGSAVGKVFRECLERVWQSL